MAGLLQAIGFGTLGRRWRNTGSPEPDSDTENAEPRQPEYERGLLVEFHLEDQSLSSYYERLL